MGGKKVDIPGILYVTSDRSYGYKRERQGNGIYKINGRDETRELTII